MNKMRRYQFSRFLLVFVLVIGFVLGRSPVASAAPLECGCLDITGSYECSVACVARDVRDGLMGFIGSGEIDTIGAFAIDKVETSDEIYKVEIISDEFTETEIGPFVGCTLYTATESVSDNQFPVLEEYIFQDSSGPANGFTKVVRNPDREDFKTCKVECIRKIE